MKKVTHIGEVEIGTIDHTMLQPKSQFYFDRGDSMPGVVNVVPVYQRNFVYTNKRKSDLIKYLLDEGQITTPIQIVEYPTTQGTMITEVVDGTQRLSTLKEFVRGEFGVKRNGNITKYKDLTEAEKSKLVFTYTKKSVKDHTIPAKEFVAINTSPVKLTAMEIRNGRYSHHDEFKWIKEYCNSIEFKDMWMEIFNMSEKSFKESTIRSTHIEEMLTILACEAESAGEFDINSSMNAYIDLFIEDKLLTKQCLKAEYESDMRDHLRSRMAFMKPISTIARAKYPDMFSGRAKLNNQVFLRFIGIAAKHFFGRTHSTERIVDVLHKMFLKDLHNDFKNNDQRGIKFWEEFLNCMNQSLMELKPVPRGAFSKEDILKKLAEQDWKCSECDTDLSNPNSMREADHITPVNCGGKTEYNNMQVLCRTCNRKKGAK